MKEKTKKNIKDTLKDIVALVCIIAVIFGGYKVFQNYKTNQANSDESYKVKTERNNKYDGYYSLTKLDEKGNNTWDGLMLHVQKDKIVSCMKYDYTSEEEIKNQIKEKMGTKKYELNNEESLAWQAEVDLGITLDLPVSTGGGNLKGNVFSGGTFSRDGEQAELTSLAEFVCKDKINFNKVTDTKTEYDYMKDCGLVPAYDEESKEVWLSKLLSNKKSEYHDGYKLIKYKGLEDINSKYGK